MRKWILSSLMVLLAAPIAMSAQTAASRHIDIAIDIPKDRNIKVTKIGFLLKLPNNKVGQRWPYLNPPFDMKSDLISGREEIPSGSNVGLLTIEVIIETDPGTDRDGVKLKWQYDLPPLDMAAYPNQSITVRKSFGLAEIDVQAVSDQIVDNDNTTEEVPTTCKVEFVELNASGSPKELDSDSEAVPMGAISAEHFPKSGRARVLIPVPSGPSSQPWKINVVGAYLPPSTTAMNQVSIVPLSLTADSVNKVKLVFDEWQGKVRQRIQDVLAAVPGVGMDEATTIAQVEFERDGGCAPGGVRWQDPYGLVQGAFNVGAALLERKSTNCWRYYNPVVFLNAEALPTNPDFGDGLTHEWVHEMGFVLHAQAGAGGNHDNFYECGSKDDPHDQNFPWDEATSDFLGSYVLARVLDQSSGLKDLIHFSKYPREPFWLDTNADKLREVAIACTSRSGPNPGSYVEATMAGALMEVYTALGFDADKNANAMFQRFVKDWMAFAAATQDNVGNRTGRVFFRELRTKVDGNQKKLVDQVALWYLIWTRQQTEGYGSIAKLIPVQLHPTNKLPASTGQPVSLRASALMFRRLAGLYRDANSRVTVRLLENGKEISPPIDFHEDKESEGGFNYAAVFAVSWPCTPGQSLQHLVQAEVKGSIIPGTVERLGLSDPLSVSLSPAAGCNNQNQGSGTSSTSNSTANTSGGHWERGDPSIEWIGGPPTDTKTGKKLGNVPSGGESWFSGNDKDHLWSNTIESAGPSAYAYHSFFLPDQKGFNYHYTGSWTLPPTTLTPGQQFTMHVTAGEYGGASCYTWEGETTNNSHFAEATRGNPSVTSQPYTIPDGGKNAQFGFFCGTSILNWHYTYHWVGGGGN